MCNGVTLNAAIVKTPYWAAEL